MEEKVPIILSGYLTVELRSVVVTLPSFILSQTEDNCPTLNMTGYPILIKEKEHPINFTLNLLKFENINVSIYYILNTQMLNRKAFFTVCKI